MKILCILTLSILTLQSPLFAADKIEPGPELAAEQKQCLADLAKRGAAVQPLAVGLNWQLVSLRGQEKVDTATFALLAKLPQIVELDLTGTQFSPDAFAPLANLVHLQKLSLARTNADDSTLATLKALPKLESLNLFGSKVTDAGLQHLHGKTSLKRVYLFDTAVTDAGVQALKQANTTLQIERGWKPAATPQKTTEAPKTEEPPKPTETSKPAAKPAAALSPAKPEEVGLDPAKLDAIRPAMDALIQQKRGAGVVTLVVRDGRIVHHEATGMADIEKGRRMTPDAIFWVASMTKNLTATAVMILVEEGKLALDEPAQKWVPELAKIKLTNGQAPVRPVTLRDLLSHTSGVPDPARKPTDGNVPLARYTLDIIGEPFEFQPGEQFSYSFGTTIAGRCVEVAAGKPFELFLREHILEPLKMRDTTFAPDAAQRLRIAQTYKRVGENLIPAHNAFLTSDPLVKREAEPSGGLFSTAYDMARFYEMIRQGGELDGQRILSAASIAEMTKTQKAGGKAIPYGLGWFTNGAEKKTTPAFGPESYGHGGAFGTHGWVDPERRMTVVFMVQNVLVPQGNELRDRFCELAAGAVK